jgi:NSS family neurotransmitter:Na+ symporter
MPFLFILMIVLMVCSLTTAGVGRGLRFLFYPDFSKIDSQVVLAAMAQSFYSLSLGMGCMCTYASYFSSETNIPRTAVQVGILDTMVAIMAGVVIFPAVFSIQNLSPDAGPSLVFIALPNIFQKVLGGMPAVAYICSLAFYLLLVVATLTSTISLHEVVTAAVSESRQISRKRAAWIVTGGCFILGALCSLSMGVLSGCKIAGMNLFDLFDFVTAKLLLLIAGFGTSVFTGWVLSKRIIYDELTNDGNVRFHFFRLIVIALKYVVPACIALVFLDGIGLLNIF